MSSCYVIGSKGKLHHLFTSRVVGKTIYTRRYPERATELIQYNHIIHTAALTYVWENVYLYDRDFRLHLSRYPHRSWSVILQQAWTMRLKDRNRNKGNSGNKNGGGSSRSKKGRDICWRYNTGRCTFGTSCKFDHHCAICNKFGHGAHICHKVNGTDSSGISNNHHNHGGGGHNGGMGDGQSSSSGKTWYSNNFNQNNSKHYDRHKDKNNSYYKK